MLRERTAGSHAEHFRSDESSAWLPSSLALGEPQTAATLKGYYATGPVFADEVLAGLGGTRPTHRIRLPLRSNSGSTPKLF